MAVVDAVVIGAGPNGLAAAFALARGGREVLVVEAADEPGGAVRSEALTLPGFVHDVCSAVYPTGAASPTFARMDLEAHGLRWSRPDVELAHALPEGNAIALVRDLEATAASLDALGEGEGAAYRRALRPLVDAAADLVAVGLGPWPPLGALAAAARRLGPGPAARTLRLAMRPVAHAPLGPLGRALLAANGLHADLAPDQRGSAVFGMALCFLAHAHGWPSPVGGAGALRDALVRATEAAGARIRCRAAAEAIDVRAGRVAGVVAGGARIPCRAVVADTGPSELVRLVRPALPGGYARQLLRFRRADGAFKVDWALDSAVPWLASACRAAGTVHLAGDLAALRRQAAERRSGRLPEHPLVLCGQQSLADPSRAPAGRHTLWAYCLVPARLDWDVRREAYADQLEQEIEGYAPGFRARVLARSVHTPLELERLNRNLVGGDVGGGAADGLQLVFRPALRPVPHATPVRGLVLGSASTPPGGGVHGACGENAARLLLHRRWC